MLGMRFVLMISTLLMGLVSLLPAQTVTTPAAEPPMILSDPVVNADRTVTFHYAAPSSATVTVALEGEKEPIPMVADGRNRWTLTTAALAPEYYSYHFEVNKYHELDPRNVMVKASYLAAGNSFLVPGETPGPWEMTAVPHGVVEHHWFTTKVVKGLERDQDDYFVYTPPGYDARAKTKYPVLYLLHGWSDTAGGWSVIGHANDIFDNLIAQGKMKPMIVVMPLGYGEMSFVRSGFGVWNDADAVRRNVQGFAQSLLTEVLPQVETIYNISARKEDRAIAGLSMGGLEAVVVGLRHSEMFDYVGGFSAAAGGLKPEMLMGADGKLPKPRVLWIGCGTDDGLIEPNRRLAAALKAEGLAVTEYETPGLHVWQVWRDNLVHFAPLLFQGK